MNAGWNTDAVGNIEKLCNGLGLDLYTDVINWEEMKDLQGCILEIQNCWSDLPQDYAFSGLYKFAKKNKIKYVLTGGNFSLNAAENRRNGCFLHWFDVGFVTF
jgi:hypothetical protein